MLLAMRDLTEDTEEGRKEDGDVSAFHHDRRFTAETPEAASPDSATGPKRNCAAVEEALCLRYVAQGRARVGQAPDLSLAAIPPCQIQ
jgi:hypothetical protein